MNKNAYLSNAISNKVQLIKNNKANSFLYLKNFPKRLFKYRKFDEYTEEMINDNYIYLTPAIKLDDQFECRVNTNLDKLINDKKQLLQYFIDCIVESIDEIPGTLSKEKIRSIISSALDDKNYTMKMDVVRKILKGECPNFQDEHVDEIIGTYALIMKGAWMNDNIQGTLKGIFEVARDAKTNTGIGSLSETNSSQVMWEMCSNHYEGYCIEYDFRSDVDSMINTFPVIYGDKRKTNIIGILFEILYDAMLARMTNERLTSTESVESFIKLYVTKYKEWSFQKEWRIIGEADMKFYVPKIKAIYLGKKVSEVNKNNMISLCQNNGIKLYQQEDNFEDLTIRFKRLM